MLLITLNLIVFIVFVYRLMSVFVVIQLTDLSFRQLNYRILLLAKCALKLLQCLFSFEELAHGNPSGITTAKDDARKNTISKLDPV